MTASRQHADALILGHSLEAALTAVLLRKRGLQVVWAGAPPKPTFRVGDEHKVQTAPALFASLEQLPALRRVLDEAGVGTEVGRALVPVTFQTLGPGQRADFSPYSSFRTESPSELDMPPRFRAFRLNGWEKRRRAALAALPPLPPPYDALRQLMGDEELARDFLTSPHWLPGGEPWLLSVLGKRFEELGGRTLQHGLRGDLIGFKYGFSGVELKLATGEELGARVLLVGADDPQFRHLSPGETRPERRIREVLQASGSSLWRLSFVIRSRGLPALLAQTALIQGDAPLLLERRASTHDTEELSIFWRSEATPDDATLARLKARLLDYLPFYDRHVVTSEPATRVPFADVPTNARITRIARRVLVARTPALSLSGPSGGALLAEGLAELSVRLAPRERTSH